MPAQTGRPVDATAPKLLSRQCFPRENRSVGLCSTDPRQRVFRLNPTLPNEILATFNPSLPHRFVTSLLRDAPRTFGCYVHARKRRIDFGLNPFRFHPAQRGK